MTNWDAVSHVRGESWFVDDMAAPEGALHAAVLSSPSACGRIAELDLEPARGFPGVRGVLAAGDVPGENQIGSTVMDEELLADGRVNYAGQPVALVIAETAEAARRAARRIRMRIEGLPAVFDAREAHAKGMLIGPVRTFSLGDVEKAWEACDIVVSGRVESGAQEHLYLETQAAFALPAEDGGVRIVSSTQSPGSVQRIAARVLGVPMNRVEVEVWRLGGAFGGKESQATPWAVLAALAAFRLKAPVKLVLNRREDMRMTGKRHPYSSDFKIGLAADGRIIAYDAMFYQNAGAAADLSPAILERTLFHATGAYFVPNVRASGASCRTNLPPSTAFRGFGAPQAAFVMESAIYAAAHEAGVHPSEIQRKNLLRTGDELPYGMKVENGQARRSWRAAESVYGLDAMRRDAEAFNREHSLEKKGLAVLPVCFGICFTTAFLNQAGALVHVYVDGSVGVSAGAVEMGQGASVKIRETAARVFSLHPDCVGMEHPGTGRVAGMSPTAASVSADLNGHAVRIACEAILARLKEFAAEKLGAACPDDIAFRDEIVLAEGEVTNWTWRELVAQAYFNRINLSAQAHYATPGIFFDRETEKGRPFAYHVFGTAIVQATVDCLRGTYRIDAVKVAHDFGESLDPLIDRGQVEGGIVQGIGWMTVEEASWAEDGGFATDSLSTYKIPDIHFAPRSLDVHFLEGSKNPPGLFHSKGVGEPPFLYGIGAYFAVWSAMRAFKKDLAPVFSAPLTPEKVLLRLCGCPA